MCGILCVLNVSPSGISAARSAVQERVRRLRHRGPDWGGIHCQPRAVLAHERLGVVDPESGHQPIVDGPIAVSANGEIYNHAVLRQELSDLGHSFSTGSDCAVIGPLFDRHACACAGLLDGQFAFVASHAATGHFMAARDPVGIVPLYYGWGKDGAMWFASEMKAIVDVCPELHPFPPGHTYSSHSGQFERYFNPAWLNPEALPSLAPDLGELRRRVVAAVEKRLAVCDVPWGVLLSGGLDSSVVASVAARACRRLGSENMHTFSIGLDGSPDLAAARSVSNFLGTQHHEYVFTVREALDAVRDVIYHLETYDVTTVRASTPMYLMSRRIRSLGIKMVLSGEGADEVLAGYLYFHKAPGAQELHTETLRKLQGLHLSDCLRANKAPMAWGLEARFPFLDRDFLAYAFRVDPTSKLSSTHPEGARIEKDLLRRAFDEGDEGQWLPSHVLWRQKEQFSDGVGYGWIDALKEHAAERVSDGLMGAARHRFPFQTPRTKEAYLIRQIFEELFPQQAARQTVVYEASVACSTPAALEWDEKFRAMADTNGEQSGRAVAGVHAAAY